VTQEAKVRVRLDTSLAKGDLDSLTTSARGAVNRIGGTIRQNVGAAVGAVGGFAAGTATGLASGAMSSLRGPSQSTASALMGDTFGALATQIEMALFGDAGPKAKAAAGAREWMSNTFAFNVKTEEERTRLLPYFKQRRDWLEKFEVGRQGFNSDDRFYAGAMPGTDAIGRFAEVMGKVLKEAVQDLVNKIRSLWPF